MAAPYETIVVGVGAVGSAVLLELARRGRRVIGFERHAPGHDRGSSHGETRVIRLAYFEHPDYVPLLRRAFDGWAELERDSGEALLHRTPLVQVGPADGEVIRGVLRSATEHQLNVEVLEAREASSRFPHLEFPPDSKVLVDGDAGVLEVERCVETRARLAVDAGAELRVGVEVRGWTARNGTVEVTTSEGAFRADRLVLCPGAWAPVLCPDGAPPLRVLRKSLFWFRCSGRVSVPVFLFERAEGVFYGFPARGDRIKVAEHSGGTAIEDPGAADRAVDPLELGRVEAFVADHLPAVHPELVRHEICFYTMTPDGHFALGSHPLHSNVFVGVGLSGHGFKFAPVLGEALADLVTDGDTKLPIGFLSPARARP